jgi:MFS transporter, SP family, sugar:H+ symporter
MAHGPLPGAGEPATVDEEENYILGRVIWLAVVAALGGFLFGFDSAVVNGAKSAIQENYALGEFAIGLVVSIALIGSAVGAWFAGTLANKYGRRKVMIVAAILFFLAGIGQAFPFSVYDLMFWRFVGGAGIGIASVIAPMYIAEIAPAHLRGRLGSLQQLAIVTGIFASALSNYIILKMSGSTDAVANEPVGPIAAWQWMFLVMVVPAAIYGLLALRIPESPRYLVSQGEDDQALAVLNGIYTVDQSEKVAEIKTTVSVDDKPKFNMLLGNVLGLKKIVWIGILLSVFQQFVGINVIFYYSNTIWSAVGYSADAFGITLLTNTTNVVVTLVAIALVDRIGRRPLLLIGSAGMAVSLGLMAVLFQTAAKCTDADVAGKVNGCTDLGNPYLTGGAGVTVVLAANLYVVFFGVSWGPIVWVLLGEIFPNKIRAAALAVAAAAQWAANFIVSVTFPTLAGISLGLAYLIYTTFAVISFFFVLRMVKETKGKSLEQLSREYGIEKDLTT